MEIIPAILTDSPEEVKEKISLVEGLVNRVQIDIIDGEFAQNKAVGLEVLSVVDTNLLIDVHLMTKEPVDWVEKCVRAQADRVIGQIEMMSDQLEFVGKVQETGAKLGLAIDLPTQVDQIDETILKDLDVILVMSVKAGFGSQEFQQEALEKVKELKNIRESRDCKFRICVDGGVEVSNIKDIYEAGADEVSAGSSFFEGILEDNLNKFKRELE